MIYLFLHTAALGLLAVLLWLPGNVLDRHWFSSAPALRLPARFCLGLGFWIAWLFVLAVLGGLTAPMLWGTALGLVGLSGWTYVRSLDSDEPLHHGRPRVDAILALAGFAAVLTPLYLLAMTPTVSWDASAYHLTLPKLYLAHGGFREVPFNVYSYWPLNIQLLYAMAMAIQDYVLAKVLHFGFGVLTLYTLYLGCRAFHRPASGVLAAALLLANGVVAYEMRVAYVDLAHTFLFLAGFLFMLEAIERRPEALRLCGICCGLAAGVKVSGIVGAGIIGLLYLPHLAKAWRRGEPALRPFLIRFVAPVVGLWLPWILRAAWTTGNPFYPFFYETFGGPDWSSTLTAQLQAWQSSIGMGRAPIDYLLLPLRVILAGDVGYERFDGQIGAFWIVILPLALWAARRVTLVRRCLFVAGAFFVFWSLSSQQMRFLIPVLPLLAMAGGVAIVELLERLRSPGGRRIARGLAFAAILASLIPSQGRVLAAGYKTLGIYLQAKGDLKASAVQPIYGFINQNLPPAARVLFLNTNQAFFSQREVLADSFFEASQVAHWMSTAGTATEMRQLMAKRGVTHILLEVRQRPIDYPAALGALFSDPALAKQLLRSPDGRFLLFELI